MASWCENMALPPRVLIGPRESPQPLNLSSPPTMVLQAVQGKCYLWRITGSEASRLPFLYGTCCFEEGSYVSYCGLVESKTGCPSGANGQGSILSLRHPKLEEETQYLFIDGQLHEFNWFKERYGSWFLGDYVCEDGSIYYCTLVDPTFVLLPLFEAARMSNGKDLGKFRQLDEILYIEGYPGYQHLMSIAGNHMELVCEVKEVANMKFFRLDESKVLTWLCCKVHSIKEAITKLGKNYAAQGERELLKEAVQIIRENLKDEPWLTVLCKKLQLDINEINDTAKTNETSFCADSSPVPAPGSPSEGNVGNGSAKSSKGRPAKKLKAEVGSKNIQDMFRRVTRNGK